MGGKNGKLRSSINLFYLEEIFTLLGTFSFFFCVWECLKIEGRLTFFLDINILPSPACASITAITLLQTACTDESVWLIDADLSSNKRKVIVACIFILHVSYMLSKLFTHNTIARHRTLSGAYTTFAIFLSHQDRLHFFVGSHWQTTIGATNKITPVCCSKCSFFHEVY